MTTKTIHFTPGRVYCVNLDNDDGTQPLLVRYLGPERPWQDICSGEQTHINVDDIDDVTEVPPIIVDAITLANHARPRPEELAAARDEDDAPEMWEHDIYWDD